MTTGDCFIMIGSNKEEPMTLYQIDCVRGDKMDAFSTLVKKAQIMGWDFPDEYDNDIPEEAIELPRDTYSKVKQKMQDFATQSQKFIHENLIDGDFEVEIGKHYAYGGIYTLTKLEGQRAHFDFFRVNFENISPCWTSEMSADYIKERMKPVSEELYQEMLSRYKSFVAQLQDYLFTLAKNQSSATCKY